MPVLKDKPSSFVCLCCLRNSPKFPTIQGLNTEYALLPNLEQVEKVFKAKTNLVSDFEGTIMPLVEFRLGSKFCPSTYYALEAVPLSTELSDLRGREEIEEWLYALWMKTAIPVPRPSHNDLELVYSPLNLTIFFKVLTTLSRNGYPAHWLAHVLTTILNNRVSTSARPPRSYPLQMVETKKEIPHIHMDLEPFLTEFRSLATLRLLDLPFGLISSAPLPSPSDICQYIITFTDTQRHGDTKLPVFTIFLVQWKYLAPILLKQRTVQDALRRALLSDEKGFGEPLNTHSKELRKHCAILTTLSRDDNGSR